jgi:hypothetical protein
MRIATLLDLRTVPNPFTPHATMHFDVATLTTIDRRFERSRAPLDGLHQSASIAPHLIPARNPRPLLAGFGAAQSKTRQRGLNSRRGPQMVFASAVAGQFSCLKLDRRSA